MRRLLLLTCSVLPSLSLAGSLAGCQDGAGSALYALQGDIAGEGCVDVCLEGWPPMLVSDTRPSAAAGLLPNLVATVQRPDGTHQVRYGNKPLYRYVGDTGVGRTIGHGVKDGWGQWHVVGPDGDVARSSQRRRSGLIKQSVRARWRSGLLVG